MTWDRRLYFPSEGRRAEDFFALKFRQLRPGLNLQTWALKASMLPLDHRRIHIGISKYDSLKCSGMSYIYILILLCVKARLSCAVLNNRTLSWTFEWSEYSVLSILIHNTMYSQGYICFRIHRYNCGCYHDISHLYNISRGTAVAQWLRCCAGVSGFFIDIKSFRSHYGPGVDSASNRNEYQEYFLGVKAAGA